jgi:hypothetical protein
MIRNFKKGFARDYEVKLMPGKLQTLCEVEWLIFGLGCPPEGMLDVLTIQQVWHIVAGEFRHLDLFPYIGSWLEVSQTLPPWAQLAKSGRDKLGSL